MTEIYKVDQTARKFLFEGVQGENESRSIQFDITPWTTELGNGAVTATAKRPTDAAPYPVTVTRDGNTVTWKPTSTDTAFDGAGMFQLEYTVDDVLAKTCIWSTMVAPSLDPAGDPPDPYDNWLAEMRQIAADALQDAQDADASAQDAEAWAKGTKNGTPVSSSDAQYQNNAKYFAEESYKNAEAWAVGQRGGVDVPSTDPTYENNAKYWAGQAEELKDETQAIVDEARADVFEAMDGLHEETTAGSALQLISDKYTENKEPYLFRKSIAGDRELDTLVGGSVAFNQMIDQANALKRSGTSNGITFTDFDGEAITLNGTTQSAITELTSQVVSPSFISGHKYLFDVPVAPAGAYMLTIYGTAFGNFAPAKPMIFPCVQTKTERIYPRFGGNGISVTNFKYWLNVIDLTQMFGTAVADRLYAMEQANAGSGIALFRSWFSKDYYAYNTGELMSVKTSAHETVGFNQWDEQWEVGSLEGAGNPVANANCIRSKNFCECFGGTDYYLNCTTYSGLYYIKILWFDSGKNHISSVYCNGQIATSPANARYFKLSTQSASFIYGGTYLRDICFSFNSDRNGEYQPYTKHTYALDDVELRGVMKLDGTPYFDGDTYEADGTVTRKYGIVGLGTLEYSVMSSDNHIFTASVPNLKSATTTQERKTGIFCAKYPVSESVAIDASMTDKSILRVGALVVRDTAYSTGQQIKTALSGVYLVYELATPTTETADPFTSPQIVDAYGTERYVDERTVAVPAGHVTKYPDNLREKLDGLPWDFSSLIAPTEKAYTATRNYTTGALLIVNNTLYKVTANIANGGAITPNTNVVATTLSEVISAL